MLVTVIKNRLRDHLRLRNQCFNKFMLQLDKQQEILLENEDILKKYNEGFEMDSRLEALNPHVKERLFFVIFNQKLLAFLCFKLDRILKPVKNKKQDYEMFGKVVEVEERDLKLREPRAEPRQSSAREKSPREETGVVERLQKSFVLRKASEGSSGMDSAGRLKSMVSRMTRAGEGLKGSAYSSRMVSQTKIVSPEKSDYYASPRMKGLIKRTKMDQLELLEMDEEDLMSQKKSIFKISDKLDMQKKSKEKQIEIMMRRKIEHQRRKMQQKKEEERLQLEKNFQEKMKKIVILKKQADLDTRIKEIDGGGMRRRRKSRFQKSEAYKKYALSKLVKFQRMRDLLKSNPYFCVLDKARRFRKLKIIKELEKFEKVITRQKMEKKQNSIQSNIIIAEGSLESELDGSEKTPEMLRKEFKRRMTLKPAEIKGFAQAPKKTFGNFLGTGMGTPPGVPTNGKGFRYLEDFGKEEESKVLKNYIEVLMKRYEGLEEPPKKFVFEFTKEEAKYLILSFFYCHQANMIQVGE